VIPRDYLEQIMTDPKKTQTDAADDSGRPTVYTYPDGSQRVGQPPFPKLSPKEEEARAGHADEGVDTPMNIPQGYKTEGEKAPDPDGRQTADQFVARVEQKLRSDVISGKDPSTPNYTTSSDKPELAGTVEVDDRVEGLDPADPKDLDKLVGKVHADVDATDEQVKAAAVQIARETPGEIVMEKGGKTAKKAR